VRLLARVLVCALAGVGTALAFAPHHLWPLLPFMVAALTLATRGVRPRRGFWLGAVYGAGFMLVLLPWLQVIGWYAWLALGLLEALFYGIAGIAAAVTTRHRWWPVGVALSWVLLETGRTFVPFGGFPWGRLAFMTEDTPASHWLAWVGTGGTTFLLALVGTAVAWAVTEVRRHPGRAALVPVLAVLVAGAPSEVGLPAAGAAPVTGESTVLVAAVQGNVPGRGLEAFAERRAVLDNHVQATLRLAHEVREGRAPRPDMVIWPENSSDIDPYQDLSAHAEIADAAQAVGVPLLMGAVVGDRREKGWFNRAIVWRASGEMGPTYDKRHAVPFGEYIPLRSLFAPLVPALRQIPSDMVSGGRVGVLEVGRHNVGVLMCFEVAYDNLVDAAVRSGAGFLVVPTNNATYTGTGQIAQQYAMSRLRAIETGRAVVVASTNGISGIIAPDGHVIAQAPVERQRVLEARVPVRTGITPGVRIGPWVERVLSLISLIWLTAALWVGYRRRLRSDSAPALEGTSSR